MGCSTRYRRMETSFEASSDIAAAALSTCPSSRSPSISEVRTTKNPFKSRVKDYKSCTRSHPFLPVMTAWGVRLTSTIGASNCASIETTWYCVRAVSSWVDRTTSSSLSRTTTIETFRILQFLKLARFVPDFLAETRPSTETFDRVPRKKTPSTKVQNFSPEVCSSSRLPRRVVSRAEKIRTVTSGRFAPRRTGAVDPNSRTRTRRAR